jgi:putative transposase
LKLAKKHEKIANQRNDYHHKVTKKLISENQAIAVEDLNIKGMVKNHCLAQSISDVGCGSFVQKLEYKGDWTGKTILKIGRFEPSSKLCHVCGYQNKDLTLNIREWKCPSCNTSHDRDINAAINIKQIAPGTVGTTGWAC